MAVKLELLKTAGYFTKLDEDSLLAISRFIFAEQAAKGEVILWEGEADEAIYFVISGQLKLFATSDEGREFIVRIVYGGDSINDDSAFAAGPSMLTAMTLSPVVLYGVRKSDLAKILRDYPLVSLNIAQVLAARQRYLIQLATELVFKNVTGRLARLLLEREKLALSGTEDGRITQQEMAAMIGTVREIVSRSLRELEAIGAITMRHNQIIITNRDRLLELSRR